MNEEQINEAMRLGELWATYAWKACSHGADETAKSQAGRAALEAYLRTIGEPENTFPLNPNGASKWAHLQKHDGAQAIGVVFRTGTGSVGSLVDGRVVWADWLAHPNGSKPESVNAEMLELAMKTIDELGWDDAGEATTLAAAAADADEWLALIEQLHNNGRGPWKFSDPESAGKLRGCRASLHRFIEAERAKDQPTEAGK